MLLATAPLVVVLGLCAQAETVDDTAQVQALIERMVAAEQRLNDSSFTMHKREWHDGHLSDELLVVKFRKPGAAKLEWKDASKENSGRVVSYASGRLKVKIGFINLELDDGNALVKSNSRHSPRDIGFPNTVRTIARDFRRSSKDGLMTYSLLPKRTVYGAATSCYKAHAANRAAARAAGYYGVDSEVCVGDVTHMPLLVKVWNVEDGAYRLVEDYQYEDVKLNVGLVDKDVAL